MPGAPGDLEDVRLLVMIVITAQLNKSSMNLYIEKFQIVPIYFSSAPLETESFLLNY